MTEAEKKALELYPTSLNLDRIMEISACRKAFLKGVEHAKQSDREEVKCRNCDEPHGEGCCCEPQPQEKVDEIAREEAEARALELYPIHPEFDVDRLKPLREAYLQGWEEAQDNQLREAAEKVVDYALYGGLGVNLHDAIVELEKALK